MPHALVLLAAGCAVLFWLLRAIGQAFLCLMLVIYPTPSLLAVLVMALAYLCIR
jgi:hypothetical protein